MKCGEIWNQYKWSHTQLTKLETNANGILFGWRDNSTLAWVRCASGNVYSLSFVSGLFQTIGKPLIYDGLRLGNNGVAQLLAGHHTVYQPHHLRIRR